MDLTLYREMEIRSYMCPFQHASIQRGRGKGRLILVVVSMENDTKNNDTRISSVSHTHKYKPTCAPLCTSILSPESFLHIMTLGTWPFLDKYVLGFFRH